MNKTYKIIFVIIVTILLLHTAYQMGVKDATPLTKKEIKEAIQMCNRWGGKVIYDQNGKYMTCSTNGRVDGD